MFTTTSTIDLLVVSQTYSLLEFAQIDHIKVDEHTYTQTPFLVLPNTKLYRNEELSLIVAPPIENFIFLPLLFWNFFIFPLLHCNLIFAQLFFGL